MRPSVFLPLVLLALAPLAASCGTEPKAASSREAIQNAEDMQASVEEKSRYLIGQAKSMIASDQFQGAIDIAQYVLTVLDRDSQEAKAILERARQELASAGQKAVGDAKKSLGF
jgi:hypothetical protein